MAKPVDIVVEIPPPEVPPAGTNWWALGTVSVSLVVGVVWFVLATAPRLPSLEWESAAGPPGVNLDSIVATGHGFALLSGMTVEGVLLWTSADGATWESVPLRGAPSQLATVGDGLFAYDTLEGRMMRREGERWVGSTGAIAFPDEIRARQSSGRPSVVGFGEGLLAMSLTGDVWWATDGAGFERVVADPGWGPGSEVELVFDSVCRPPSRTSPDVPPIVEIDSGLIALISSNPTEPFGIWPVCEPRVWFSPDGLTWTATDTVLEEGAYIYDIAAAGGVLNAVGGYGIGAPAAWTSSDGLGWEPLDGLALGEGTDLFAIEAGPGGWVALGRATEGSDTFGWTSLDGRCWEPIPWQVSGLDAAVGPEDLLILDRSEYPEIWHASRTGGTGACG